MKLNKKYPRTFKINNANSQIESLEKYITYVKYCING